MSERIGAACFAIDSSRAFGVAIGRNLRTEVLGRELPPARSPASGQVLRCRRLSERPGKCFLCAFGTRRRCRPFYIGDIGRAGVPSDQWPTGIIKIVSGSGTSRYEVSKTTGEPGRSAPQLMPSRAPAAFGA